MTGMLAAGNRGWLPVPTQLPTALIACLKALHQSPEMEVPRSDTSVPSYDWKDVLPDRI